MIGLLRDHLGDDFFVPFGDVPERPSATEQSCRGGFRRRTKGSRQYEGQQQRTRFPATGDGGSHPRA